MGPYACSLWETKTFSQKSLLSSLSCCISSSSDMKTQPCKVSESFIDDIAW